MDNNEFKDKLLYEINEYLKEVEKYDKSNGMLDVSYHNGQYKAIEEILKIKLLKTEVTHMMANEYEEKVIYEINEYLKEVEKYDKSNDMYAVAYHNGQYKAIEEILKIIENI